MTLIWPGDDRHTDYNVISKKLFDIASVAMPHRRSAD
jgi:hypothetical protein